MNITNNKIKNVVIDSLEFFIVSEILESSGLSKKSDYTSTALFLTSNTAYRILFENTMKDTIEFQGYKTLSRTLNKNLFLFLTIGYVETLYERKSLKDLAVQLALSAGFDSLVVENLK